MPRNANNLMNESLAGHCHTGIDLLHNPALNKGSAFTDKNEMRWDCAGCCHRTSIPKKSRCSG